MTEYNEGDLVEAVKGETVVRARLVERGAYLALGVELGTVLYYQNHDYAITVIEKAAPKVVLPTEPGIYQDRVEDVWTLTKSGRWLAGGDDPGDPAIWTPLTRLEPVSETAKKILDRVREMWPLCNDTELDEIAAEFGVEL
jgi:hypothetical protein